MHFVGMFALEMPGMEVSYSLSLVVYSFAVAAVNSGLSLYLFTRPGYKTHSRLLGAATMAIAIAGMHYIAMFSMKMAASIQWNVALVFASVMVAFFASLQALNLSYTVNKNYVEWLEFSSPDFSDRRPLICGSIYLGLATAGMHYTGMMAATFVPSAASHPHGSDFLGTPTLSTVVVSLSMLTLSISIVISQLDRSLARSSARLRKEKELRNHFFSAIVHDLRNPLSAAILCVEMISKVADPKYLRTHLTTALDNLNRMDLLIQTLLDAQRISTGHPLPIHTEHFDLCSLLRTTLEGLSSIYGDRFQLECGPPCDGDWDPLLLRRAVENLCTNAVKYGARNAPRPWLPPLARIKFQFTSRIREYL